MKTYRHFQKYYGKLTTAELKWILHPVFNKIIFENSLYFFLYPTCQRIDSFYPPRKCKKTHFSYNFFYSKQGNRKVEKKEMCF